MKNPKLELIQKSPRGKEYRETMHNHADLICDHFKDGMAAYVLVGIGFDGTFSRSSRTHKDAFFGQTMLPVIVAEILRRDTATDACIDVLNGNI